MILLPSGQIMWSTWDRTRSHVKSFVLRLFWNTQHQIDEYSTLLFSVCFTQVMHYIFLHTCCSIYWLENHILMWRQMFEIEKKEDNDHKKQIQHSYRPLLKQQPFNIQHNNIMYWNYPASKQIHRGILFLIFLTLIPSHGQIDLRDRGQYYCARVMCGFTTECNVSYILKIYFNILNIYFSTPIIKFRK